jgi:serine protease AprX
MGHRGTLRLHRPVALAWVAALALLGSWSPALAATKSAAAEPTSRVVIVAAPHSSRAIGAQVRSLGGRISRDLPFVDGFAATVPTRQLTAISSDPAVRSVTPDIPIHIESDGAVPAAPAAPPTAAPAKGEPNSVYPQALRADQVWQAGDKGQGVTVALIDTGVTANADLAGRLVTVHNDRTGRDSPCENLSGEPTCYDSYGHGTFVAGIIAGNGAASHGVHSGVAPQAELLAVKVAGADGSTDVSNILAAIQWVVSFQSRYHIRVLNLSLATDSKQTYLTDPFNYAVERAWDAGIVVVVSASNRGPKHSTISKPGDDPLVVTVGAIDDRGTPGIGDHELPRFTARGPTPADGLAKPDVVAPGADMVSLRSIGSTIDRRFRGYIDRAYHRGSGTSFSAAATSGVVALVLARNPSLQPDQVKFALMATARALPASSDQLAVGKGEVDAAAAALNPPPGWANSGVPRSNGTGVLDLSRGHVQVQASVGPETIVNGLLTAQLLLWDPSSLLIGWNPLSWYVSTWEPFPWLPIEWSATDWPGHNWGGHNWGGGQWNGSAWGGSSRPRRYGTPIEGAIWFGAWG